MGDKIDLPKEFLKRLFDISEKNGHPMQKNMEQAVQILDFYLSKPTRLSKFEYLMRLILEIKKGKRSSFYEVFWNPHNFEL